MTSLALPLSLLALATLAAWLVSAAAWPVLARLPPRAVPTALTIVLALGGALALASVVPAHGAGCHCEGDAASVVHLCAFHPERAMPFVPFAVGALALLLLRPALAAARLLRSARATRAVVRACERSAERELLLTGVPIRNAFAVGSGGGRIVVDRAWWAGLQDWERDAVLAHERAHLRRRDPLVTTLLSVAVSFVPPRLAIALLRRWRLWAEQCADAVAAREIGDPEAIAELLIRQHRPPDPRLVGHPALTNAGSLEHRVEALLQGAGSADDAPPGAALPLLAIVAAGAGAWLAAPAVHHVTESIIAWMR